MGDNSNHKVFSSVTLSQGTSEGRIEKLLTNDTEGTRVRISCWSEGRLYSGPLDISEKELVTLLYKAIRTGILSPEFLNNLHAEFEI